MKALTPILLALLFLLSLMTAQAVKRLPAKELRQRSRSGRDRAASAIYSLAGYGTAGRLLVWLIGAASLAALLFLAFQATWWIGLLAVLAANGLTVGWRPAREARGWAWSLASLMAGLIAYLLSFIKPAAESFNRFAGRFHKPQLPSGIYEKDDLLALLKAQPGQLDNRIDESDLRRAIHALNFADKTVGQLMLPNREIKWVPASEPIGPTIMDELHKTGQTRFPVVRSTDKAPQPEAIGTLYIGQLLDHLDQKGRIKDLMNPGAYYINEASNLEQALDAYLKTGSQLLIAVDGRGETVGILDIDKVLEQALGQKINDSFGGYDNPHTAGDHEPSGTSS